MRVPSTASRLNLDLEWDYVGWYYADTILAMAKRLSISLFVSWLQGPDPTFFCALGTGFCVLGTERGTKDEFVITF